MTGIGLLVMSVNPRHREAAAHLRHREAVGRGDPLSSLRACKAWQSMCNYSKPGYKSRQSGFVASIKATFFARGPALSCFSRLMASNMVACNSK